MRRVGFLSFGWWSESPGSVVRTARDMLLDTVDLAVAAEEAGLDGAWIRVHHFDDNLSSPFPVLAAMATRTSQVELGTGVINMRYENPLYMAELAATTDLLAGGRLQLGVSRGSPEPAADGPATFGYPLPPGVLPVADAAERIARLREAISGHGMAEPGGMSGRRGESLLPVSPHSPGLGERIWYGAGSIDSARIVGQLGMNLMSSTLVLEATGEPLGTVQARQIRAFRQAWADAGHAGTPRVSVSRSVMPIVDEQSDRYFGGMLARETLGANRDQIGVIDNARATFGKTYVGDPDRIVEQMRDDEAVAEADTLLVTVPNTLGAAFNATTFDVLSKHIKPALTGSVTART